jgi:organic radical activating enzyme
MEKKFICDLPWTHISVHPHGTCSVCCIADHSNPETSAANYDDNGLPYNVVNIKEGIDGVINSDTFKKIRKTMIEGGVPAPCKICHDVEKTGGKSKRLRDSIFNTKVDELTQPDGTIVPNLKNVEVRLGNYCNLKCRSCNAESSTSWIEDYYKLKDIVPLPSGYDALKKNSYVSYDWVDDDNFYNDLINNSKNINQLHISGGEPFLVPKHFYLLDKLIEDGLAQNINIYYITNVNYNFEKIKPALEKLKKFKFVNISFSIDDVRERNSYIRSQSKWDLTIKNIKNFIENYDFYYTVTQTISAYNFMYIEELSQFLVGEGLYNFQGDSKIKNIIVNHVHSPDYQNANIIPIEHRINKIDSIAGLVSTNFHNEIIGRYYNSPNNNQLDTFKKVTDAVDSIRNQKIKETFPKLYELIYDKFNE